MKRSLVSFFVFLLMCASVEAQTSPPLGRWHKVVRLNEVTSPPTFSLVNCDYRIKYGYISSITGAAAYRYFTMASHETDTGDTSIAGIAPTGVYFTLDPKDIVTDNGGLQQILQSSVRDFVLSQYSKDVQVISQRLKLQYSTDLLGRFGGVIALEIAIKGIDASFGAISMGFSFRDVSRFTLEERCY